MDVFVRGIEDDVAGRDPPPDVLQRAGERSGILRREQAGVAERSHVRDRRAHVLRDESQVEPSRTSERRGLR
jgi:hypothetical protein